LSASARLSAPGLLHERHVLEDFDCGREALNKWLSTHALSNQRTGYTKVIVVANDLHVVGSYGLSVSSVRRDVAPRAMRPHPAPTEIPCLLLGQLAVDVRWQGRGVASGLLKDVYIRTLEVAERVGTRALVVNALDDNAGKFWEAQGFTPSKVDPYTLFASVAEIQAAFVKTLVDGTFQPAQQS
jgi:GNAT superfamily N-acetyltransferase